MPTLDLSPADFWEHPDRISWTQVRVYAVMLHPSEARRRADYLDAISAERKAYTLEASADYPSRPYRLSDREILFLRRAPGLEEVETLANDLAIKPTKGGIGTGLHAGEIAALTLLVPLLLDLKHNWNVANGAAKRVLHDWLANKRRLKGASERNLQAIWDEYQPVAHLWAAEFLLHLSGQYNELAVAAVGTPEANAAALADAKAAIREGRRIELTRPVSKEMDSRWGAVPPNGLVQHLALAEWLLAWGLRHRVKRAASPLLDSQAWRIPLPLGIAFCDNFFALVNGFSMPPEDIRLALTCAKSFATDKHTPRR